MEKNTRKLYRKFTVFFELKYVDLWPHKSKYLISKNKNTLSKLSYSAHYEGKDLESGSFDLLDPDPNSFPNPDFLLKKLLNTYHAWTTILQGSVALSSDIL